MTTSYSYCSISFLSHPPTPTQQHIEIQVDKRKESIIHRTYYTLHGRGVTLFCREIYSYHFFFFLYHFFLSLFSLLIIIIYFSLSCINHITPIHTHTHTHTHTPKRNDPVLYQFKIRQEEEKDDDMVLVSFPFLVGEKGRIVHCTYYTIYNSGGTLFYPETYSHHDISFSFLFYYNKVIHCIPFYIIKHTHMRGGFAGGGGNDSSSI